MDDLLIAAADAKLAHRIAHELVLALQQRGFVISPEKIQTSYPFLFLGFHLDPELFIHKRFILRELN